MQKLQDLLPLSAKLDLLLTFLILCRVIWETFFITPTPIYALTLYAFALTNPDYFPLSWKIM